MSTSKKDYTAIARVIADQYLTTKAFQGLTIRNIAEGVANHFAATSKTFDRERFIAAALPDRPCDGYVFVDVCDEDVIHVYPAPANEDECEGVDFIWDESKRERESDRRFINRHRALQAARMYAEECATKCGCEWGDNA